MKVIAVLLATALLLPTAVGSGPIALLTQGPSLKPSLNITLYPDGTFSVHYHLDVLAPLPPEQAAVGNIKFRASYHEGEASADLKFEAQVDLTTGSAEGEVINETAGALTGKLRFRSSEEVREATLNATLYFEFVEAVGSNVTKEIRFNLTSLESVIRPEGIDAEFSLVLSGVNASEVGIPITTYAAQIINQKLIQAGITYVKFDELQVSVVNDTIEITGWLTADVEDLLTTGVEAGIITRSDREEIEGCLERLLVDLEGEGSLTAKFTQLDFESGSVVEGGAAGYLTVEGNLSKYGEVSRECSVALNKLGYLIGFSTLMASGEAPPIPPLPPEVPEAPDLRPAYPFTQDVSIDIELRGDEASATVDITVERYTYAGEVENPEEALRLGMSEFEDAALQMRGQFAFLEMMGISSPIPDYVTIKSESVEGMKVITKEGEVGLWDLSELPVRIEEVGETPTPTATPPPTQTVTVTEVETVTVTETAVETETVTETLTVTSTETLVKTTTETVTHVPPLTEAVNMGLVIATALLAVGLLVVALLKRK